MKFTILGSGTFVPELKRKSPSFLLENRKEKIVFDFGRGAIDNLLKLNISLYELDWIFISHMHIDHFSDLFPFIQFIIDAPEKRKLKSVYKIYGPKGIKKIFNQIFSALYPNGKKNLNRIEIIDLPEGDIVNCEKIKIKSFRVEHSKSHPCFGYLIQHENKKICYSGDTRNCENLRRFCENADLAIIEATGSSKLRLEHHLTGEEVGRIAKEHQIKKLIIVHVAKDYLAYVEKDIKKNYKGKIIIAKDLMVVKI